MRALKTPGHFNLLVIVLAVLAGLLITSCVYAQAPTPERLDDYLRLFPVPTGRNGYEDFVLAEDALRKSAGWITYEKRVEIGRTALAIKRGLLADKDVKRALSYLRRGLQKVVQPPQESSMESARFSEMGGFRALGRLLCVQMYVLLSEGAVSEAINCMGDALRFAGDLQTGPVIAGLSAVVIDEACVKLFAEHLNEMSAKDCERMVAMANAWMLAPDPALTVLSAERERASRKLEKYREHAIVTLVDVALMFYDGNEDRKRIGAAANRATGSESTARSFIDQVAAIAALRLESNSAEFRKPYWQRSKPRDSPEPERQSPEEVIADELFGCERLLRLAEHYTRDQTMVQMLGVHAAICRFRWEHGELPSNLTELGLGSLAIDAFSGKQLMYERLDSMSYKLSSVGPYVRGVTGQGQRLPIMLPAYDETAN